MRRLLVLASLALAFAAATWVGGWLGVVAVALSAMLLLRALEPVTVGAGAALAWLGLVAGADRDGSLGRLTTRLGGVFGVPGWAVITVTALFAFLLAWSAARLVTGLRDG